MEWTVYGLIEPYKNRVIYTDVCKDKYVLTDEYINDAINKMVYDENPYVIDLINMNEVEQEERIHVIVFGTYEYLEEAQMVEKSKVLEFKPRYYVIHKDRINTSEV